MAMFFAPRAAVQEMQKIPRPERENRPNSEFLHRHSRLRTCGAEKRGGRLFDDANEEVSRERQAGSLSYIAWFGKLRRRKTARATLWRAIRGC
jgi:hypothetical protein